MHLVTFQHQGYVRLGTQVIRDGSSYILDLNRVQQDIPADLLLLLRAGGSVLELAREASASADKSQWIPESEVTLLAPLPHPGKILCVGHNYKGHIGIGREELPEYPNIFSKTANTITGPGQPILIPQVTNQVDYEAELMIVIGKTSRQVSEREAQANVAGYTIFNDVSARDFQKRTSQWLLGKSFNTFGPMGPTLVTADEISDPHCLDLELTVNGVPRQHTNTRDMIFSVPFLVSYLSAVMTLEPGDVIATGTPAKLPDATNPQRFLEAGDVVRITIEKLGSLENTVAVETAGI
ncbi:MAG: fumarylacetoacetate hydrolase family protein [Anaerolineaceae bacterium]